jgi:hypothetical protein
MRKYALFLMLMSISLLLTTTPVKADLLFDNPSLGMSAPNSYAIDLGYTAYDDFILHSNSTVNSIVFRGWTTTYEGLITSVHWTIYSDAGGTWGSPLFSGTSTTGVTPLGYNLPDPRNNLYQVDDYLYSVGNLNLSAGVYWLSMNDATMGFGQGAYWEVNNSTSGVFTPYNGALIPNNINYPPEYDYAFSVYGTPSGHHCVPEPTTMLLLGLGLIGLAGVRRKFKQ